MASDITEACANIQGELRKERIKLSKRKSNRYTEERGITKHNLASEDLPEALHTTFSIDWIRQKDI